MAVRSLARSGIGTGGKYISFLAGNTAFSPDSDFVIEEQILASSVASVTFTSIPQTYKHLQIRYTARGPAHMTLKFNSATSGYAAHELFGENGAGVYSGYLTSQSNITFYRSSIDSSETSGSFGAGIIDILDYSATTKNKTARLFYGTFGDSTRHVHLNSGFLADTSAITSITITGSGANLVSGSRFTLYGSNG